MATSLASMSPTMLAQLKKSPKTITICWKPVAEGDAIVLYAGYPKDIATTFSSFIRSKFPPTKSLTLVQMQVRREPSCITIVHPKPESVKKTLGWMVDCCSGTGLKQYEIEDSKPVTNAYFDLDVATYLDIPYLVNTINTYINHRLTMGHLPAIEVQTLLESTTLQDPIFGVLVQHVASRVWQDMQARRQLSQNSASPQGAQNRNGKKQEPPRFKSGQYNGVRGARESPTVFSAAVNTRIEGYKRDERAAAVAAAAQAAGSSQV